MERSKAVIFDKVAFENRDKPPKSPSDSNIMNKSHMVFKIHLVFLF